MGLPENAKVFLPHVYPKGKRNLITDVPGVKVGMVTLRDDEKHIHTGVTAILPHEGNLFQDKVLGAVSVINGFGKSVGLVQVEELGTIESPIMMTNTLSVGTALNATVKYLLEQNEDIGVKTGTVNCVITECNDGSLSDIRGLHVTEEDCRKAIENAGEDFPEGAVASGSGMICLGLKGGMGSASRIVKCDGHDYTLGAIVMSNFGMNGKLRIDGQKICDERCKPDYVLAEEAANGVSKEKGSIIIVLGTDIPFNERQLRRVAKRATVSLARTGSYLGNGSGDLVVAFTNGNRVPHYSDNDIFTVKMFNDDHIDKIFEATAEVVEEAIISALYHAETLHGIRGNVAYGLQEFLK